MLLFKTGDSLLYLQHWSVQVLPVITERRIHHFPKASPLVQVGARHLAQKSCSLSSSLKLNSVTYLLERQHGIKLVRRWLCWEESPAGRKGRKVLQDPLLDSGWWRRENNFLTEKELADSKDSIRACTQTRWCLCVQLDGTKPGNISLPQPRASQHLHGEQWVARETALVTVWAVPEDGVCRSRLSRRQICMCVRACGACLPQRQAGNNMYYSYLCWISRLSFLFLVWSAGEGEFKFLVGGATSAIVSLEPSWSEAPLSVFLHLALRFWNHTWSRRAIQAEYCV